MPASGGCRTCGDWGTHMRCRLRDSPQEHHRFGAPEPTHAAECRLAPVEECEAEEIEDRFPVPCVFRHVAVRVIDQGGGASADGGRLRVGYGRGR
jgi:hypothetical protein